MEEHRKGRLAETTASLVAEDDKVMLDAVRNMSCEVLFDELIPQEVWSRERVSHRGTEGHASFTSS